MSSNFTNLTTTDPLTLILDNVSVPVTDNMTNTRDEEIDSVVKYIEYITMTVFCIVGIIGHALTIAIMSSKYFRSSTTSVYLSALAISDSLFLILSPFTKHFINELIEIDIQALSRSGCKSFFCFYRAVKLCSAWFVVVICMERFVAIWFPLKAKLISTKSSAIFAVSAIIVSAFTLTGFWTMVDDIVNGVCIPNMSTTDTKQLATAFLVAGTALFSTIPTTIILIFTPLTILKLFRQQSIRLNMNVTSGHLDVIRITKTLLCVMIAYVVLVTPIATAHAVAFFSGDNIFESENPDFVYFRAIAQMCENLNYSINFFLYVVSSQTFRKRLFQMLNCVYGRRDRTATT